MAWTSGASATREEAVMAWINGACVSIEKVAAELHAVARALDAEGHAPWGEGCDVRLQVVDGTWALHTGDASYDQDHRGAWGATSLQPGATKTNCRELARDLVNEAADQAAQ